MNTNPLQPWKPGDPFSATHLNQGLDVVRQLSMYGAGPLGFKQTPAGTIVDSRGNPVAFIIPVMVKLLANLTARGQYWGRYSIAPVVQPNGTIDTIIDHVFNDPGFNNCLVVNAAEIRGAAGSHILPLSVDSDAGDVDYIYPGFLMGLSTETLQEPYAIIDVPSVNNCCCPDCGGRFTETQWIIKSTDLTAIAAVIAACAQCGVSGHTHGAFSQLNWNSGAGPYADDSGYWLPGGSFGYWTTLGGKDFYAEMGFSSDWNAPNNCCVYLMLVCYESTAESGAFNCGLLYFGTANKNCSGTLTFTSQPFPGYTPVVDSFPTPTTAGACPQGYSPAQMQDGIASVTPTSCLITGTITLTNAGP